MKINKEPCGKCAKTAPAESGHPLWLKCLPLTQIANAEAFREHGGSARIERRIDHVETMCEFFQRRAD